MAGNMTVGKMKKKLDLIYSRYIRKKHADHQGYARCVSCRQKWPWEKLQCGHFVSRRYSSLRYDERNTKPQCFGCNLFRGGNMANFAIGLQEEYGEGIIKILARESQKTKQFTVKELQAMIKDYESRLAGP
jgi:hypothetical protein